MLVRPSDDAILYIVHSICATLPPSLTLLSHNHGLGSRKYKNKRTASQWNWKNARKLNGKREHGAKEWENQLHFPLQLKFVLLVCAFFLLADSLQLRKISNVLQSSNGAIHYPKVAGQSLKIMCNAWYEFCCNKRGWPVDKQSNNNCTGLWKLRSMGN